VIFFSENDASPFSTFCLPLGDPEVYFSFTAYCSAFNLLFSSFRIAFLISLSSSDSSIYFLPFRDINFSQNKRPAIDPNVSINPIKNSRLPYDTLIMLNPTLISLAPPKVLHQNCQ
jgi:hypothetical protein